MLHSDSNWTFIAINLPFSKFSGTTEPKQFQCPGTEKRSSTIENARGTKVGMPWCTGRF